MRREGKRAVTEASTGRLLSVNVGMGPDIAREGRIVHTGICKDPVDARGEATLDL